MRAAITVVDMEVDVGFRIDSRNDYIAMRERAENKKRRVG